MLGGLARIKTQKEDFNGAIEIYKRVIATDPGDPRAGYAMIQIAQIFLRDKEYEKANVLLDQVTRSFAGDKGLMSAARDMQARIKKAASGK